MVRPRFCWAPPRVRSLGPDCSAFWRDAGGDLFDWQEFVLDGLLGLDEEDRFVTGNDGLCVARQNGKGVIEQALEVFFAFELGYRVVMHTAHEFATSQEHQFRLEAFIQDCPHLHAKVRAKGGYKHANGQESINLRSGCRIVFKARTKGGGRGYSGDLLVWDEAMVVPPQVVAAQKPMLRASKARHGPKTLYAGSAVDQDIHEHGVPFALIRERGLEESPHVAWFEWSAPFDHPDEMTEQVLRDRSWWHLANPSMPEGLIADEWMAEEIESMPGRTAAVELGCVGDWPRTDGLGEMVIDPRKWSALEDKSSRIEGPVVFTFDVAPDRSRSAVAVTGKRKDGLFHVEVDQHRAGTGWVAEYVAGVARRHDALVACDDKGPASSLVPEIEEYGVKVTQLDASEYADACGVFFDAVDQGKLRHGGTAELASALRGAGTRPLSDKWAWSRKHSKVDISPLVACTIGVWVVATTKRREPFVAFA